MPLGAERKAPRYNHRPYAGGRGTAKEEASPLKTVKPLLLFGGDKRDRTADLLNAIQALSQLSYTPMRV